MTNNCSLPSYNMKPPPPPMSMLPNFSHPQAQWPHHGHGFGSQTQQYGQQFYNDYGQQQFSNQPPMANIPNLMQMTGGFQNTSNKKNYMNSNTKRQVNNIWSQPSHQLNLNTHTTGNVNEGNGHNIMQGRQFHQNQSKWNRYGCQNGNNGNHNKNQQKKEKIDKRDLAENNVFYCDACDRGFKTEQVHTEHVKNHQKCSYKGCSYVAAPKLVELHCKLQHRNGYAKKIWSLESKEDIENWIKTRKSKYPTAANITEKNMLSKEKIERGEVLETKQFGKMKGRGKFDKRDRNDNWKRKNEDSHNCQDNKKVKTDIEKIESITDQKEVKGIKVDDPLSILMHSTTPTQIINDLDTERNNDTSDTQSVGLTSILTCYGSDTDSSDNDEEVTTGPSYDKQIEDIPTTINGTIDNIESDPAPVCKADKEDKVQNKESGNVKRKRNRNKKKANFHNEPRKKKPSLLEMLLAKEIRHERNVISQCVHYIVKKNFFEEETS